MKITITIKPQFKLLYGVKEWDGKFRFVQTTNIKFGEKLQITDNSRKYEYPMNNIENIEVERL